jgi:hypothetical protein
MRTREQQPTTLDEAKTLRIQLHNQYYELHKLVQIAVGEFAILNKKGTAALVLDRKGTPRICFSVALFNALLPTLVNAKKPKTIDSYVQYTVTKDNLYAAVVTLAPTRIEFIDSILADLEA